MHLLRVFCDLGDPGLLAAGALALFVLLLRQSATRGLARPWVLAAIACLALTVSSKLLLFLFGLPNAGPWRLHSPSGHAALATGFYGCCALLLAQEQSKVFRLVAAFVTMVLLASIAAARWLLGLHSLPEIAAGLVIGVLAIVLFRHLSKAAAARSPPVVEILALLLIIGAARFIHLDGEALIIRIGNHLEAWRLGSDRVISPVSDFHRWTMRPISESGRS